MHTGLGDDRYGYPGKFSLFRCSFCGLIETYPKLLTSQLGAIYSSYYPRGDLDVECLPAQATNLRSVQGKLKAWLTGTDNQGQYTARRGMRVLDYGCGAGVALMELEKIGAEAYGIEVDENSRRVASRYGLRIHTGSLEDNPFPGVTFDLICLNQVIEHIPDPADLLSKLESRLASRGVLALSFPNTDSIYRRMCGRRWINWHVPYHLHHFSLRSFTRFCDQHGWHVVQHRTITPTVWTILQLRTAFTPETASTDDSIWQSSSSSATSTSDFTHWPGARQALRLLKRGAMLVAMAGLTLVNRVVDAVGMGDSLLVVIRPNEPRQASAK